MASSPFADAVFGLLQDRGGLTLGDVLKKNYQNSFEAITVVGQLRKDHVIRVDDPGDVLTGLLETANTLSQQDANIEDEAVKFIKENYDAMDSVFLSLSDKAYRKFQK